MAFDKKNKDIQEQILKQTEIKFAKGKRQVWKNRDFEDLSHVIHLKTKVLISVATLKRLFGKVKTGEHYSPHDSTIDALIKYSEFSPSSISVKSRSKKMLAFIFVGLLVSMAIIGLIISLYTTDKDSENTSLKGKIEIINTEGSCPTTAYFGLEVPDTNDSVFVNFGDGSKPFYIRDRKTISHFYAYPGQFVARLRSNKNSLGRSKKILVPTNGWQSFTYYFDKDKRERYHPVPMNKGIREGVFHVSPRTIGSLGLDTTDIISVRLDNYKRTDVNGDSFSFHSRLKCSSFWPAIRCYSTIVTIDGALGKIQFKLVSEGCSTYALYQLGEIVKMGSSSDLSSLVIDRNNWLDIDIKNSNKQVQLLVNEKEIFVGEYQKSIGAIIGTSIEFHGSGFVDNVNLTIDEECIFEGEF